MQNTETAPGLCIQTNCPRHSRNLGAALGSRLAEPVVIGLEGDLGCGKTVFAQGIARGLEVPERYPVTSPTYTFINEYPGRLPLCHVDLYRISDPEELTDIGFDDAVRGGRISVIEWAERLGKDKNLLDMLVCIAITGDSSRIWRFFCYRPIFGNLIRNLEKFNLNQE
ncbi:MAG: tRNA (adenosine(37)-N6)-threonylcarbamoyltransferase complex ATPase subunit type 1 TsaE [Desulfosalsimonadaceae bacterium]